MPNTKYGDISQRTAAYAAADMLAHAGPVIVLSRFAQNKPLPKNKADTVKFRRPIPFAHATTPLTEGVTPTSQQMQYEDVTVQLKQYGAVVEITDVVHDLAEDPVLKDSTMLCGEQAGETVEVLTWSVIQGGTNVFYSNGASRSAVNTPISLAKQRAITRSLKANKGKKITSMLSGSPNYSTQPVDAAYIAFSHTDLEGDIRDMPGFTPVEQYGQMKALPYEVGKVEDVRYILSPVLNPILAGGAATLNGMTSDGGSNVDIYPVIYIAKESFGCVPLKGEKAITPSVINPGKPSKSDPLGQLGYVGWKTYFEAVILNEAWIARLECGATAAS